MTPILVAPVSWEHKEEAPVPTMDHVLFYTLQPLKMKSGTCQWAGEGKDSLSAAPHCR